MNQTETLQIRSYVEERFNKNELHDWSVSIGFKLDCLPNGVPNLHFPITLTIKGTTLVWYQFNPETLEDFDYVVSLPGVAHYSAGRHH